MNERENLKINQNGHLEIGGCDTVDLASRFSTPLYLFDRAKFENNAKVMVNAVKDFYGNGEIAYASKAFACEAVFSILNGLALSIDVVSGGELYLAIKSGFNTQRIYFHGNAKTDSEIDFAVSSDVGVIVLESFHEIDKVSSAALKYGKKQKVMVRVNPGVEAHTHSFIQTANTDSKFGVQLDGDEVTEIIKKIILDDNLNFIGLHTHIGSQIFDVKPYKIAVEKLVKYIKFLQKQNIFVQKLNIGGGFGVKYTESDPVFNEAEYRDFIKQICNYLTFLTENERVSKPIIVFEPGRSLVGEAGITLYTVISIKNIEGIRKYVSVDGGMFENPRYALYGARYDALICDRANDIKTDKITLAGKCCESGDLIATDVMMQPVKLGDIIAVLSTGAYNYSMASNYNCNLVPPVVMVYNGTAEYIIKPQTYADLARNNVLPESLKKD